MLCRRIHRLSSQKRALIRRFSDDSSTYSFSQLRAYPFNLSKNEAIRLMAPFASVLCGANPLSSIAARFGFNFEPFQPLRITPVYFPAWIVDGELKAKITFKGADRTAMAQFQDTYIPGSDYPVISNLSQWSEAFKNGDTLPFTEDLKYQQGSEVALLPYTISPFAALDILRSMAYSDMRNSELELSIWPSSIEPNLIAAYPVLIPYYLAQFQESGKDVTRTVFMEAFTNHGPVMCEGIDQDEDEAVVAGMNFVRRYLRSPELDKHQPRVFGPVPNFVNVSAVSLAPFREMRDLLQGWLEHEMKRPGTARMLAEHGSLNHDDPRIREFTQEERETVNTWLELGIEVMMAQRISEAITSGKNQHDLKIKIVATKPDVTPTQLVDGAIDTLQQKIIKDQEERDKKKPSWWDVWEKMESHK